MSKKGHSGKISTWHVLDIAGEMLNMPVGSSAWLCSYIAAGMMMILHQIRHGRQDNHATNHVRCAETSRAKQSRRHIEATWSNIRPNPIARPYGGIARPYTCRSCWYACYCSFVCESRQRDCNPLTPSKRGTQQRATRHTHTKPGLEPGP
jgi:hypothetical protein